MAILDSGYNIKLIFKAGRYDIFKYPKFEF